MKLEISWNDLQNETQQIYILAAKLFTQTLKYIPGMDDVVYPTLICPCTKKLLLYHLYLKDICTDCVSKILQHLPEFATSKFPHLPSMGVFQPARLDSTTVLKCFSTSLIP